MRFDANTMTQPRLLAAPAVVYSARALDYEVQGTSAAVCAITVEGTVVDCRIVKTMPFMDEAVLRCLTAARFTPALQEGKPVEVDCLLTVEFRLH